MFFFPFASSRLNDRLVLGPEAPPGLTLREHAEDQLRTCQGTMDRLLEIERSVGAIAVRGSAGGEVDFAAARAALQKDAAAAAEVVAAAADLAAAAEERCDVRWWRDRMTSTAEVTMRARTMDK